MYFKNGLTLMDQSPFSFITYNQPQSAPADDEDEDVMTYFLDDYYGISFCANFYFINKYSFKGTWRIFLGI